MDAPAEVATVAAIPDGLSDQAGGPAAAAGATTFNPLRRCGAMPGDLVAAAWIGGRGVTSASSSRPVVRLLDGGAIGRGAENAALAKKLGASGYIDSTATNAAQALQARRRRPAVLSTAPSAKAMSEVIDGLGAERWRVSRGRCGLRIPFRSRHGQLIPEGDPLRSRAFWRREHRPGFRGHADAPPPLTGVRPMIETFPARSSGRGLCAYAELA